MTMQETFSVTQLTDAIKKQLETAFPLVSVKGEISNFKEQGSGHLYFTLKDETSQLSCVFFRGPAKDLSHLPKNGDQVIIHGQIQVYPPRGSYQLLVRKLEYAGLGELLLKLHALKIEIAKRGWFNPARRKPLPKFPKTIGVVTSATGSVIQDILHILNRRNRHVNVLLNPVKVQGDGAAVEIANAIEEFNRHQLADVLIIGRGGGSLEDLWAFNEEIVANAIFQSQIPIISAVGHETDHCIADYVADLRAPTPSSAAELATTEALVQIQFLTSTRQRLQTALTTQIQHHKKQLRSLERHPLLISSDSLLSSYFQRVDEISTTFSLTFNHLLQEKRWQLLSLKKQNEVLKPTEQISILKEKLLQLYHLLALHFHQDCERRKARFNPIDLYKKIDYCLLQKIQRYKEQLNTLVNHLKAIDPKNLLKKGYSILFNENKDSVILSSFDLKEKDRVHLLMHDAELGLTVDEIKVSQ